MIDPTDLDTLAASFEHGLTPDQLDAHRLIVSQARGALLGEIAETQELLFAARADAATDAAECQRLMLAEATARRERDEAQAVLRERAETIAGYEASVHLRHSADMRGIALWREENPEARDLEWPSHDDLVCFLFGKLAEAEEDARLQTLALIHARAAFVQLALAIGWTALDSPRPEEMVDQIAPWAAAERRAVQAEQAGAIGLRNELGARDEESFPAFIRRLHAERTEARARFAALQTQAAALAQAAAQTRSEAQTIGAEAVRLVPVEQYEDELTTSLGRFPISRIQLPGAVVMAIRILQGDAQLAQHLQIAATARFGKRLISVLTTGNPDTIPVRFFRFEAAEAPPVPGMPVRGVQANAPIIEQPAPTMTPEENRGQFTDEDAEEFLADIADRLGDQQAQQLKREAREHAHLYGINFGAILRDFAMLADRGLDFDGLIRTLKASTPPASSPET